mmetsp:Transcript_18162/g.32548  ORF Transcript_18162/g.32548 Transcript_18162/m.32548 type:complete len:167 (+) Transcript_18162:2488-2988(+)
MLWEKVMENAKRSENLYDSMEACLDTGDLYAAYLISSIIKMENGDAKEAEWVLSMQETPIPLLLEAVALSSVMELVVELVMERDQKVTPEFYEVCVDYWQTFLLQTFEYERNAHLESLQPRLISCLKALDLKQRGFLNRARGRLSWISKALRVMCATAAWSMNVLS